MNQLEQSDVNNLGDQPNTNTPHTIYRYFTDTTYPIQPKLSHGDVLDSGLTLLVKLEDAQQTQST